MHTIAHAAMLLSYGGSVFNYSRRKVGGITFIKLGRFNVSFSLSRAAANLAR
jgi:hypothetical protein